MDKEGLKDYILELIPVSVIEQLKQFQEPETIREIVTTLIRALHPLPPAYTGSILSQLHQLSSGDPAALAAVEDYVQKTNKRTRREKNSLILVILVTLALCLLIFLAGR